MNIKKSRYTGTILLQAIAVSLYGHSVPTHHNITHAAVDYLKLEDTNFSCFNDTQVQIGTGEEDDTPRFVFHFYPALNGPLMVGSITTNLASPDWGLIRGATGNYSAPIIGTGTLTNTHTWPVAVDNAKDSAGNASDLGWVDLGFVVHLLEDLTSPAHVRNDPHPPGDGDPVEAEDRVPTAPAPGGLIRLGSPRAYFDALQAWTRSNFFSKDTCFDPALPGPVSVRNDSNYFYDAAGHRIAYRSWRYILSGTSDATRNLRATTIDDTIATEQFQRLGPQAVLYAASLMQFYFNQAHPLVNAIQNGNFETGDLKGWTPDTIFGYANASIDTATEGRFAARIGRWDQPYTPLGGFRGPPAPGVEPDGVDFIYQDVTLESDATALELSFDYNLVTYDGADYDWLDVQIFDATTGALLSTPVSHVGGIIRGSTANWGEFYTTGWRSVAVDLLAFKGRKVRLMFTVTQDGFGDQIATYVDNVKLKCSF